MTCSGRLLDQLPPCRWDWYMTSDARGYSLRVRHAHPGGLLTDCAAEDYGPYTHGELSDVLAVLWDEAQLPDGSS